MKVAWTHDAGGIAVVRCLVPNFRMLESGQQGLPFRQFIQELGIETFKLNAAVTHQVLRRITVEYGKFTHLDSKTGQKV